MASLLPYMISIHITVGANIKLYMYTHITLIIKEFKL